MKLGHLSAKIITDGHTRIFANQTARVLVIVLCCPMTALEAGTVQCVVTPGQLPSPGCRPPSHLSPCRQVSVAEWHLL